jgi:uncharacterized protein YbaR (Trm112 family)
MIDAQLIALLRCPDTRRPLRLAAPDDLARINQLIAASVLKTCGGKLVPEPVNAALLRDDGKIAYAIRNEIPILLIEEGMVMETNSQTASSNHK